MALLIVYGEILVELAGLAGRSAALAMTPHPDADYLAASRETYNISRQDTKAGFRHFAQLSVPGEAYALAGDIGCGECARLEETRPPEPDIKT